jgi:hypothetical protein
MKTNQCVARDVKLTFDYEIKDRSLKPFDRLKANGDFKITLSDILKEYLGSISTDPVRSDSSIHSSSLKASKNTQDERIVLDSVRPELVEGFQRTANKKTTLANITSVICTITIPANTKINMVDDLTDFGILRSDVNFILKEHSVLDFSFKMVKNVSYCYQECEKHCNCPILGVDKTLQFTLQETGACAQVNGNCFGRQKRSFNFKTIQKHMASDTQSSVCLKGVLDSQAVFKSDNLVFVEKDLENVVAKQINKNLLLSDNARVITVPKLEVKSNKADCSHGAAISKLNEDHIFYLQSRGVSPQLAKLSLINAFLSL